MANILTPKGFLQVGGAVLLLVGVLGFIGILGPTPEQSIFKSFWYFDNAENVVHTILGIVALVAAGALKDENMQKNLVLLLGAIALLVGIWNFFLMGEAPNFYGANLESPADLVLHLVVGVWGLAAGMKKSGPMATPVY